MTSSPAGDGWYLPADESWVAAEEAGEHPVRQGDLLGSIPVAGEEWFAAQIVHPTCELSKASVERVQVVRVRPLEALPDEHQRARVTTGYQEVENQVRPAFAHTFFLAPAGSPFDVPMFSNLREVGLIDGEQLTADRRVAAMSHDARVTFIRRKIYFRYRLLLPFEEVRRLEANRIAADPAFSGPKPPWAVVSRT